MPEPAEPVPPGEPRHEEPLESWKEIAAYLKRDTRTVRRWEKSEKLPVRRHLHRSRASVYAYRSELDAWRASRRPPESEAHGAWLEFWLTRKPVFASVVLLSLFAADGPWLGPARSAAQANDVVARRVWSGREVDLTGGFSPDGRLLSFVDWSTGDLAVRDLRSGSSRHLTQKEWKGDWAAAPEQALWSIFSPDGAQVAYAWQPSRTNYELRVVGVAPGATPRLLFADPNVGLVQPMDWSRDGSQILALFTRGNRTLNQMVLVAVANGAVRVLKSLDWRRPARMSLSPDGRYVVYDLPPSQTTRARDLFVLATDGGQEEVLVRHAADDGEPVWAPEGNRVLFVSDRSGTPSLWAIAVADGKAQGSPVLLKADLGRVSEPVGVSSSGAFLHGVTVGMSEVQVARVDAAAGTVLEPPAPLSQRFVGSTSSPDWSPDGKYVSYLVKRQRAISIRTLATGEERELAVGGEAVSFFRPVWSPDGTAFLANGFGREGHQGLLRIDARSGAATFLTRAKVYITGPAWSPDGKAAFYWDGGSLVRYDFASGSARELAPVPGSPRANFAVSPDGGSVALFRNGRALELISVAGGAARELVKLQAGEAMTLYPGIAWTPDGRHVLFTKVGTSGMPAITLWAVSAQGGEPRRLGITLPLLRELRISPDGQRIAFTAGEDQPEIWELANVGIGKAGK